MKKTKLEAFRKNAAVEEREGRTEKLRGQSSGLNR